MRRREPIGERVVGGHDQDQPIDLAARKLGCRWHPWIVRRTSRAPARLSGGVAPLLQAADDLGEEDIACINVGALLLCMDISASGKLTSLLWLVFTHPSAVINRLIRPALEYDTPWSGCQSRNRADWQQKSPLAIMPLGKPIQAGETQIGPPAIQQAAPFMVRRGYFVASWIFSLALP